MSTNGNLPVIPGFVDSDGIHVPDFNTILEDNKNIYRNAYGLSSDDLTDPSDPDVQVIAALAQAQTDAYATAVEVYHSFSPLEAQSDALSENVAINGISRKVSTFSTVDLLCKGLPGVTITNGQAKDTYGQTWMLPATVNFDAQGEATVTATAQNEGSVTAPAGAVSKIGTPTRGWLSVTNPKAAVPGAPIETDAQLRSRQQASVALPSQSLLDGIVGAIENLDGVTYVRGYENDSNVANANGLPAFSIALVVQGGDAQEIGQIIFIKKTLGVQSAGDESVTVTDSKGNDHVRKFYRPLVKPIFIKITLRPLEKYIDTTEPVMKANLEGYINGMEIGESVIVSRLYYPILQSEPSPLQQTFDIVEVAVGLTDATTTPSNLPIAFNELAQCDTANVEIVYAQ